MKVVLRYLYVCYAILTFVFFFLLLFPFFLLFSIFGSGGKRVIWKLIQAWSYAWFFLIGMNIKIYNKNVIRKGKSYIVIANHASYLDTALIFRSIPFYVRPLAKAELAKIPLFGFLYRSMAILVDRENNISKSKSLRKMRRELHAGSSIFIFPEGTFNETNDPLKQFYDGAFKLALKTGTNILPVLFPDTVKRWSYKGLWHWSPGKNRVFFLPEINIEEYGDDDFKVLKEKVFAIMWEELRRIK